MKFGRFSTSSGASRFASRRRLRVLRRSFVSRLPHDRDRRLQLEPLEDRRMLSAASLDQGPAASAGFASEVAAFESFESGLGVWSQGIGDDMDWTRASGATPSSRTGPSGAGDGNYYLYTEASSDGSPNKVAHLESTFDFSSFDAPALKFLYHMYGSDMGSLSVDVHNGSWHDGLWSRSGPQHTSYSDPWAQTTVDLSDYAGENAVTIRIRGVTGSDYESDMAIDGLKVYELPTPAPTGVDLLPTSDTGISDADGVTMVNNSSESSKLQFEVAGTLPGAIVTIYADGTPIGTSTATATTTTVTTNGLFELDDGVRRITARQTQTGRPESADSAALAVTIDTSFPERIDQIEQLAKLLPSEGDDAKQFGWEVAIDGDLAVVGAYYDWSGSAYVFRYNGSAWIQVARFVSDGTVPEACFGHSVAISGPTVVVGAPRDDDDYGSHAGAAYVFEDTGSGWVRVAKLVASDGAGYDRFGESVAISGDRILVGAEWERVGDVSSAGSAYVFERGLGGWAEVAKITPSDLDDSAWFGASVALSGDTAIVGAPGEDCNGTNSGAAYLFEGIGSEWTQVAKFAPGDSGDNLGSSVSVDGGTAILGSPGDDALALNSGAAYLLEDTDSGWAIVEKLTAGDAAAEYDSFGGSVSVRGDRAIVGADGVDVFYNNSGCAYVFERRDAQWTQVAHFESSEAEYAGHFGKSVAIDDGIALVGQPGNAGTGNPAAYLFAIPSASLVSDTGISVTDQITYDTTPEVSMTFLDPLYGPGVDVTVSDPLGNPVAAESVLTPGCRTLTVMFDDPLTIEGEYTVALIDSSAVTDTAGNMLSGVDELTFLLDTSAPIAAVASPAPGAWYAAKHWDDQITGTATDGGSGISQVEISIRQATGDWWGGTAFDQPSEFFLEASGTTDWVVPFGDENFPASGEYTVRVRTTDVAGNTDSTTTTTFSILDLVVDSLADGPVDWTDADMTLRDAVALAADPSHPGADRIVFDPALGLDTAPGVITLTLGELTIASDIVIDGPGRTSLTIDAGGASRIVSIPSGATPRVELKGVTLSGGYADLGGALSVAGGEALLNSCEMRDCSAAYGGAIFADGGAHLKIEDCLLTNNSATASGGALFASGAETLVEFLGDTSGGANRLAGNAAAHYGGAAFAVGGATVRSIGAEFIGRGASAPTALAGGGLAAYRGGRLQIQSSKIAGHASSIGAGLYVSRAGSSATVSDNSEFLSNAARVGGGLCARDGGHATIADTVFLGNSALNRGGAVAVDGVGSEVGLTDTNLDDNWAAALGGGLYVASGASATVTGCSIVGTGLPSDRFSAFLGGGLAIERGGQAHLTETGIVGNSARYGGGVFVRGAASTLSLTDVAIKDNVATRRGNQVFEIIDWAISADTTVIEDDDPNDIFGAIDWISPSPRPLDMPDLDTGIARRGDAEKVDAAMRALVHTDAGE